MKLPRSKSRGRGSVHINFPRPLCEVAVGAAGKFTGECLKVEWNAAQESSKSGSASLSLPV